MSAYWAGQPVPELDRAALAELERFQEDLFEADAEDIKAFEAWIEEQEEK